MAGCLMLALGQESSTGPNLKLTCLKHDEAISRHGSYPITWTAEDVQANTMLSLRIQWTSQIPGARGGGASQAAESNRLIGGVLDSASERRMASLGPPAMNSPTIESGRYLWDVDKFCKENRQGNKSVCDAGVHYRLQVILRSANDPCADSLHCGKPRSLFKVYRSDGTFAFRD